MAIRFYSWPRSSGTRVHWALEELGVPYESVVLDRTKQENLTPEYRVISPGGKVPALVDDGHSYFESLAIILHLADAYGRDRGLWPSDRGGAAEALCWSVWGLTELQTYMMQYLYHGLDTPVSYAPADRSQATAAYNHGQYLRLLDALDARLAGREHLVGAFSLADIPAAATLAFGSSIGGTVEGRRNVEAWLDRCRARPAFARVFR
jgi:glutathione S-transferase